MGGENQTYPDDSLQWLVGTWWVEDEEQAVKRGRLLRAFVPHVDQQPMALVPVGRTQPTEHQTATIRLEPLRAGAPPRAPQLPVAALPQFAGEVRTVYRAKLRPVLVLSAGGPDIDQALRTGTARWQTAPTLLVAPFYGVDPGGTRGGWRPEMVERIRHCEYPQYFWDRLPLPGAAESILRFDHIQPIGRHHNAHQWTRYRLSDEALSVLDEWLVWLFRDLLVADGVLADVRAELLKLSS